jgi:hypothetical protein
MLTKFIEIGVPNTIIKSVFFISLSNYSLGFWWGTNVGGGFVFSIFGFLLSTIGFLFSRFGSGIGLITGGFSGISNLISSGRGISSGLIRSSFGGGGILLGFFGSFFDFGGGFISSISDGFRLLSFVRIISNFSNFFFGLFSSFLDSFILFFLGVDLLLFALGFLDGVLDFLGLISGFLFSFRSFGFIFNLLDSSFGFLLVFSLLSFSFEILGGFLDNFSSSISSMVFAMLFLTLAWAGIAFATVGSSWAISTVDNSTEDSFKSVIVTLNSNSLSLVSK